MFLSPFCFYALLVHEQGPQRAVMQRGECASHETLKRRRVEAKQDVRTG